MVTESKNVKLHVKAYSKMHFFLCENLNKHVFETFGFATLCG